MTELKTEGVPTPAPAAAAPVPAPAEPAVAATPAPEATPAFDAKDFETTLKTFGPDWSLANAKEKLLNTRKTLSDQGRQLAEARARLKTFEAAEPFLQELQNPEVKQAVGEAMLSYYERHGMPSPQYQQGYAQQVPAIPHYDPMNARLTALETQLRMDQVGKELTDLQARGFVVDQERADQVMNLTIENGGSPKAHYMALYGEAETQRIAQEAARSAAEAIQRNNQSYTPGPARTPAPAAAPVDVASLDKNAFREYAIRRIQEKLNPV